MLQGKKHESDTFNNMTSDGNIFVCAQIDKGSRPILLKFTKLFIVLFRCA